MAPGLHIMLPTWKRERGLSALARFCRILLFSGNLALLFSSGASYAAESAPVSSPRATVTLVSDADHVAPGDTFRIGLRQRLAPHWHTYWKNPGDAGEPSEVKLTLPDGAKAGGIVWPGPDSIPLGPVMSFGYLNEIVLPIQVTVPSSLKPGDVFPIQAEATWLVCEKECIPEQGSFSLNLPVGPKAVPARGEVAAAFARTEARLPTKSPWATRLAVEGPALALTVEGAGLSAATVGKAFFFPTDWGVVVHAAPQSLTIEDGRLRLALEKGQTFDPSADVTGVLALTDPTGRTRWYDIAPSVSVAAAPPQAASPSAMISAEALPLWRTALFAFLGGLILNLMPCVFPVLAIKATSVAGLSGGALREVRLSGLFYTLGVLIAFLALAGALLALRAGGGVVGWGFQFQSPVFVAAMAWLMLAISLNLSGVYEIGLTMAGAGQGLTAKGGHAGSFFTGLLAVVVATPCTAPFMGAALGAALAAAPVVCLALFLAMGLGLAAPYALLAVFPGLASLLPRPGRWMLRLRQVLAFPMYASAAWLVWVLTQQAGDFGLMIALAGGLLVGFAAWIYGVGQKSDGRALVLHGLAAAAVVGLAVLLPQLDGRAAPRERAAAEGSAAEPFSAARLAALRQEGKPVFVNMTAAWCITCLVNERTTLSTAAVQEALREGGIIYLKGDWTNQNPEITAFLQAFRRDGLPFYALYPPGKADPIVLPPVLTAASLLAELRHPAAN